MGLGLFRRVAGVPRGRAVANASAVSAITLGIVGVMLGTGVASTAIGVTDGVTWLADPASGEVLQYNPSTKRVEKSYQVGQAGDPIEVAQATGGVVLRNGRTGEVITVDMASPGAGRRGSGERAKVVMARGVMAVADSGRGTITRIDPVRATDVGTPFQLEGGELVAAVADEDGTIWVATTGGELVGLRWQDGANGFVRASQRRLKNPINAGAVLSPHPKGVTVFDSRSGVVAQAGTGEDIEVQENRLIGANPTGVVGPSDLVPATLPEQSSLVVLDRGRLAQYSTAGMGCDRPVDPAAFNEVIYVVCQGNQKVIRLTRDGGVAGDDIKTPGVEDAKPVSDEGRLVLNVNGSDEGIEVDRSGSADRFDRRSRAAAQSLDVQPEPGEGSGALVARENAQQDLAGEPGRGSGSGGSVNTSPDQFDNRDEVVRGSGSRGEDSSTEAGVTVPGEDVVNGERGNNGRGRGNNDDQNNDNGRGNDDGNRDEDRGNGNGNGRGNGNGNGEDNGNGSDPVPAPSDDPQPTGPAPTEFPTGPAPTGMPSGPGVPTVTGGPARPPTGAPSGGATDRPKPGVPTASASGPAPGTSVPAPTTQPPTTQPPTTKPPTTKPATTSPTTTKPAPKTPPKTPTTTKPPTTTATKTASPKPPAVSVANVKASATGTRVNVSWTGTGKSFTVKVGSKSTTVSGSAKSATLTGIPAGTHQVTVGNGSSTGKTTVTVKGSSPTPTHTTTKPTATTTTTKPAPKPTGNITQNLSITSAKKASSTSVTVSWKHDGKQVQNYRVYCNGVEKNNIDVGPNVRSATVRCGPLKGGVEVGVKGYNSAHSTNVITRYVNN